MEASESQMPELELPLVPVAPVTRTFCRVWRVEADVPPTVYLMTALLAVCDVMIELAELSEPLPTPVMVSVLSTVTFSVHVPADRFTAAVAAARLTAC